MAITRIDVLSGLKIEARGGPLKLSDTEAGLLVGYAISAEGLSAEEAWRCCPNRGVQSYERGRDRQALNQRKSRLAKKLGVPVEQVALDDRALALYADRIDARRFLAACERARAADAGSDLADWRTAVEEFPREQPLCVLHARRIGCPAVFDSLERAYVEAVTAFADRLVRAARAGKARRDADVVDAMRRIRQLLQERAGPLTRMKAERLTLERLHTQLEQVGPLPEADAATDAYLEHYLRQCRVVSPRGMRGPASDVDEVVGGLEDVYVTLAVGPASAEEVEAEQALRDDQQEAKLEWREGGSFDEMLRRLRWPVLLGEPGSGKSTAVQWLALQHARALTEREDRVKVEPERLGLPPGDVVDLGPARLPVLVSLGEYGTTARTVRGREGRDMLKLPPLRDFLAEHRLLKEPLPLEPPVARHLIERWARAGRVLLLLDGVDEVPDDATAKLVSDAVYELCKELVADPEEPAAFSPGDALGDDGCWRPLRFSEPAVVGGNQVVVTSREGGYGRAPIPAPFFPTRINPLSSGDVARFVRNWCRAIEHWRERQKGDPDEQAVEVRGQDRASRLLEQIEGEPRLADVRSNPLMLTVLTLLHREREQLPRSTYKVLEAMLEVLSERRAVDWSYVQTLDVLGPLAVWMQATGARSAPRDAVLSQLRPGILKYRPEAAAEDAAEQFLRSATEQSGILSETSQGFFGFFGHNAFREFLAAAEVAQDPAKFVEWIREHAADPTWEHVLLLGAARIGDTSPSSVDEVLRTLLRPQGPDAVDLVHRDVLSATAALLEMERGSPAVVGQIVDELITAGAARRTSLLRSLAHALERGLAALLESPVRRPQVEPCVLDRIGDPTDAGFVAAALQRSSHASEDLLRTLAAACRHPDIDFVVPSVLPTLVDRLRSGGGDVDAVFTPLGELAEEVDRAFAGIPELVSFVQDRGRWVDPALYRLLRYLLDRPGMDKVGIVGEALDLLEGETGDAFRSLALLSMTLDGERTAEWLAGRLAEDPPGVDPVSGIRFLFETTGVPVNAAHSIAARRTLLEEASPGALSLLPLAFECLRPGGDLLQPAWRWLARVAVAQGQLPVSEAALDSLEVLLEDSAHRARAEALLALMICPTDTPEPVTRRLVEWLSSEDVARSQSAAAMLATAPGATLSKVWLNRFVEALRSDGPLRHAALRGIRPRPAATVAADVVRRASEFAEELFEQGDAAASSAVLDVCTSLVWEDPRGVRRAEAEGLDVPPGRLHPAAVDDALVEVEEQGDETGLEIVLDAAYFGMHLAPETHVDLERVARLVIRCELPEVRAEGAEYFAVHAARTGRMELIAPFVTRLREVDVEAAAGAVRAASWFLHTRADAAVLRALRDAVDGFDGPQWVRTAAGLALDVATVHDPDEALQGLARARSLGDAARALLHGVGGTDHGGHWSVLEDRWNDLAARAARDASMLLAICDECCRAIGEDPTTGSWPRRRAAVRLLAPIADRNPGTFVRHAPGDLRAGLLACTADRRSYSVRRGAFTILARYPGFEAEIVELIRRMTRDNGAANVGLAWHLQWRPVPPKIRRQLAASLVELLQERNRQTILAAAALLGTIARHDAGGSDVEVSHEANAALVRRARDDDPLLDALAGRGALSLRDTLVQILLDSQLPAGWSPGLSYDPWEVSPQFDPKATLLDILSLAADAPPNSGPVKILSEVTTVPQGRLLDSAANLLLERRVGAAIAQGMSRDVLNEFEMLHASGRGEEAMRLIEAAHPRYERLVRSEHREILAEYERDRQHIHARLRELRPPSPPAT